MKHTIEFPEGFELKKVSDNKYQIVKKEVKLPDTWDEFCETHDIRVEECYINDECGLCFPEDKVALKLIEGVERRRFKDRNVLPNKEYAEAVLALCQLIQLRDCYRQGWKPDWTDASNKYCIAFNADDRRVRVENVSLHNIFSFQSEDIRAKFLDNFKDLIETASYLWK